MRIRWYFTDLPFQNFPSIINSRDWDETPWEEYPIGELPNASRSYNGAREVPGLTGEHQCGTPEQFFVGAPWPHEGPPVEYDQDWIPTCCNREPVGQIATGAYPNADYSLAPSPASGIFSAGGLLADVALVFTPPISIATGAWPEAIYSLTWSADAEGVYSAGWLNADVELVYDGSGDGIESGAGPEADVELVFEAAVEGVCSAGGLLADVELVYDGSGTGIESCAGLGATVTLEWTPTITGLASASRLNAIYP